MLDASLDGIGVTDTVDDGRVVLRYLNLLGRTQVLFRRGLLERQADFLGDDLTAGQDSDVFEHGLATITKTRGLDGRNLDDTAQVVDHQGCQRLAFDVLGDDQQ